MQVADGGLETPSSPCRNEGAVQGCYVDLGQQNGVHSCYLGQQRCSQGRWTECSDGQTVTSNPSVWRASRGLLALSAQNACENMPCDPTCLAFGETPDAAIFPDAGLISEVFPSGTVAALPNGMEHAGLIEPCASSVDCQFNHRCDNPTTGSGCAHSKCEVGSALDATCDTCVASVCDRNANCCTPTGSGTGGTGNTSSTGGSGNTGENAWTAECVDLVEEACGARCPATERATCTHDPCDTGVRLDSNCNSCVRSICSERTYSYCCTGSWDARCVAAVSSVCKLTCPATFLAPPLETGTCVAWYPGETSPACTGVNVTTNVACDDGLPVCNHGQSTAPAGIRIIFYNGASSHFPESNPEQLKTSDGDRDGFPDRDDSIVQCFTTEPIPPGQCVSVENCGIRNGTSYMVNPPDPEPFNPEDWPENGLDPDGAPPGPWHIEECVAADNWSYFKDTVLCAEPVCSGGYSEAVTRRVNLLFLVDASGSMSDYGRWTPTLTALGDFFKDPGSAGLGVALEFFPLPRDYTGFFPASGDGCAKGPSKEMWAITCDAAPCANPMVALGQLTAGTGTADPQEVALDTALASMKYEWNRGTPTKPALQGALEWAKAGRAAAAARGVDDIYSVVLVTDGAPSVCGSDNEEISELAAVAYSQYGIRTYTIGFEAANNEAAGIDIDAVNDIARKGGTGSAFIIRSGSSIKDELIRVFQDIRVEHAACEFTLTNADAVDPFSASIEITDSANNTTLIGRVEGPNSCENGGWYYDDVIDPSTVTFCPNTCGTVEVDDQARVDLSFGCRRPYSTTLSSETYAGTCENGQGPQWGFLTYEVEIHDDSSVGVLLRTADTADGLATASYSDPPVALVKAGGQYPTRCTMFGTDCTGCPDPADPSRVVTRSAVDCTGCPRPVPDPCPIRLFDALGGSPAAFDRYLDVGFQLNPATDRYTPSILKNWKVTYSCIANE